MSAKKLFISYSHLDRALFTVLRTHLKPLERTGLVEPWFDGFLLPGDEFDVRIKDALERAELIVLLVSPDFLASDYCYDVEMQAAVARHEQGTARVVPVILRECQWQSAPFGRLVALPTDGKAITSSAWPDKDAAWTIVARGIEAAALSSLATTSQPAGKTPTRYSDDATAKPMDVSVTRVPTDKDKDDFKQSAFDHVLRRFETTVATLRGGLSGRVRVLDANRFTATIYRNGAKVAGCTISIGAGTFSRDAINYLGNDSGDTNSLNDWLAVDVLEDALVLRPSMGSMRGRGDSALDPDGAAEYLWKEFFDRVRHS